MGARSGSANRLALACGLLAALACGDARAAEACLSWPGEPDPLATPGDPDALRARWAELRVAELSALAERAEPTAPVEAQRVWRHVLCIEPGNAAALAGIERTPTVRVHRPELGWGNAGSPDPWALAAAIRVPSPKPAAPPGPAPELVADVEGRLSAAEEALRGARFADVLAETDAARERLENATGGGAAKLRARLEVFSATAHVALGSDDAARASFARALSAQPDLALDAQHTSPKVMQAFEAAKGGAGDAP